MTSNYSGEVPFLKPSDFIEYLPEFGSLVDINFACLLAVRLLKIVSDLHTFDASNEDSPFICEIGHTVHTKIGSQ